MPDIFQTITGGFFDSVNQDRLYNADQMNMPYKKIVSDGLFFEGGDGGNVFKVTAGGGMTVNVGPGNALIGGKWAENEDALAVEISGNTSESARVDSIILRLDANIETRAVGIVYRQGTAAAPALDTSDGIKEFRLANITVPVNAVAITDVNISDTRGTADCPWVTSIITPSEAQLTAGVGAYIQQNPAALIPSIKGGVAEWLEEHPEATTTVQDGSITENKLSASLKNAVKDSELNMTAVDLMDSATTGLGDCTVFHGDVNGIVDFGADPAVPDLLAFLTENGITHIDFVIISHYHADHVTNNFQTALNTLVNGGIDFSDCTFYLPHKGIDWSRFVGTDNQSARETLVKSALAGHGFTSVEPTNGQAVTFTPYTSVTFWNIGDYDDYYSCFVDGRGGATDFTIYNNFSMIAVIDHCGAAFLMSGDVHELAQSKNYQHIEKCDVYKVEHHAVNSLIDADWRARIVPEFAVVEQYAKDSYNTLDRLMSPIRKYCDRGAKLLFNGSGITTIQSKGGILSQKSGGCFDLSMVASLCGGQPILANTDLDSITDIGDYYCKQNTAVATLLHCPVTHAFRMTVENPRGVDSGSTVYRTQKLTAIADGTEYRRHATITSGVAVFSDWTPEIITLTADEGGAEYFTNYATKVIKNGSLCIVRLDGTCVAATSGWQTIFTGAPHASKGETLAANLLTNSGGYIRARVTSGGILQVSIPAGSAGHAIGTTFVYIA